MSERGSVNIENAIKISRSPGDVFDYLTDINQGARVEPEDQARREAHLRPNRSRHPVRRGVDQGKPCDRRVRHLRSSDSLDIRGSFPTLGREGRGADLTDRAGLPRRDHDRAPPQGLAGALLPVMRRTMRKRED